MKMPSSQPLIPVHQLLTDEATGSQAFTLTRSDGGFIYEANVLLPHRKAYYLLVFVRHSPGRHWVDMVPYERHDNTIYFTVPSQILVKEEPVPSWGTYLKFTDEFLALQPHVALRHLPLLENAHNGHELRLTAVDVAFIEELLAKLEAEYHCPGEWQYRMIGAHLTVLLTYLSRLYTEQFVGAGPSADRLLLRQYQAKIEECFRELHEVNAYAARLHISAKHLSEVVKAQSGKPAVKHLHERIVLEARRLLFYTSQPLKEIADDLGFADVSYFSRFFKRETGVTPTGYRSTVRKMYQ